MDKDGYISNGELFQVLKMMVGNNLKDTQLQQIVDKTIIHADTDGDGKISFEEFCAVSNMFSHLKKPFSLDNLFKILFDQNCEAQVNLKLKLSSSCELSILIMIQKCIMKNSLQFQFICQKEPICSN